ncbi:MAG: xanthine dehydrogenase [Bacteroidetes bacterium]|nr:MAG: xanthine dehydrogenase [Bacteroidota bacterium]
MKTSNREISRRSFIRNTSLTGAALTLGFCFPSWAGQQGAVVHWTTAEGEGIELTSWIAIDKTGKVTLLSHRAEMGQGAFQVVPQMIAEELEVNLDQVNIQFAPGHQKKFGSQVTGGSSTVRGSYKRLLLTGATAREMLIEAAAKKWNVNKDECYAENGQVIHRPSGKKFAYGELVEAASKLDPPKNVQLKKRSEYKLVGKPMPRQDNPTKINGKAIFGIDKKLPGMLYAVVERNPRFKGRVQSFDDTAVMKVPGVKKVMKVARAVFGYDQEGVAVVADSYWAAMQGRKLLKVEWDDSGFEHLSTAQLYERMRQDLEKPILMDRAAGNFDQAFQKATKKIEAIYETPYESHSCMEPVNCVANVTENRCEVWGPIQAPDWIQSDLSTRLNIPVDQVVVNMTFLGGGFGRKAFTDYPHEACLISKAVNAPVQVIWTREDDMTQGPFRPGAVYGCKAGLNDQGSLSAFQTKMAAQNMDLQSKDPDRTAYNGSTVEGFLKAYFESIPNYSFGDIPTVSPIPVMWWRSVYASTNGFAYESFMDELAHAAGKDPMDFRRMHLDNDRYQALIDQLEEITNWKSRGKNEGWGVAITECFESIVGEVVKVSRNAGGKVKIDKVYALMDCGWYVNPDIIRAQVEGSIVMALGAAIKHETHFEDGMAVERNFDKYKMPRIPDIPEIEVHIAENDERPGGVGEPALPPFAPALCNAIYDLTGKRIRKLPFNLDEV